MSRYLLKNKKFKNKIFSLITMARERALQDSNKTNMASSTNFFSKEKKKAKNIL